ncbi:hypothetical protein ABZX41_43365, partial [Streptomyces sp. NPDC004533]
MDDQPSHRIDRGATRPTAGQPLSKIFMSLLVPLRALGSCLGYHDGTPADPNSYSSPGPGLSPDGRLINDC